MRLFGLEQRKLDNRHPSCDRGWESVLNYGNGKHNITMNNTKMTDAYKASVEAAINGDKEHGWGKEDSMVVIAACAKVLCQSPNDETTMNEFLAAVANVVNPSAARQMFAKAGLLTKETAKERTANSFAKLWS